MAEEMMNEEMTGMAAPAPAMEEPMPAAEPAPMEEEPSIDMEIMMGNFMDMGEDERKIVSRLIGEPLIARLANQLGTTIETGEETPAPAPEGMMAPTTEPMADMPMEEEEATPPV